MIIIGPFLTGGELSYISMCDILSEEENDNVMRLNIFVEGEGEPFVLCPQSCEDIRITNTHRRQMQKMEVTDADGKILKDIDCSGLPRQFKEIVFRAGWTPEVVIDRSESYEYDAEKKKWMKKISA